MAFWRTVYLSLYWGTTLLYEVSHVLYRGPLRSRTTRQSVHPSRDGPGGAARGRGLSIYHIL